MVKPMLNYIVYYSGKYRGGNNAGPSRHQDGTSGYQTRPW